MSDFSFFFFKIFDVFIFERERDGGGAEGDAVSPLSRKPSTGAHSQDPEIVI